MKHTMLALALLLAGTLPAAADGCYICTQGSGCGQYCRYTGNDDAANRKKCTQANCKIGGTASCPKGANIKICSAERPLQKLRELAALAEERPQ